MSRKPCKAAVQDSRPCDTSRLCPQHPEVGTVRHLALVLIVLLLAAAGGPPLLAAPGDISLVINGDLVETDVPPVIVRGRTLVPVRVVSEELGAYVGWDDRSRTVTVVSGASRVVLGVGQSTATVDGRPVTLDTPPEIISGRTMVPIRFVSEALGATVEWDPVLRRVTVTCVSAAPGVRGLAWEELPAAARFIVVTSGPVSFETMALPATDSYPDRILISVKGARVEVPPTIAVGVGGVTRIRTFEQETGGLHCAQVVLDLTRPVSDYRVWTTWEGAGLAARGELPVSLLGGLEAVVVEIPRQAPAACRMLGLEYEDGSGRVVIHLDGPADYQVWELSDPWRVVIDFSDTILIGPQGSLALGHSGFTKVRYAQFQVDPDVTRVVLDAERVRPYSVTRSGNDVIIHLGTAATITGLAYEAGGRATVEADRPLRASVVRLWDPDRVAVVIQGALLSGALAGGGTIDYEDDLVRSLTYEQSLSGQTVTLTFTLNDPGATAQAAPVPQGLSVKITKTPLAGKVIVLDPGHGGSDPGVVGPDGVTEAELVFAITSRLAEMLRAAGATVHLTRSADENPDKYERPAFANSVGADACVSIHLNANYRSSVSGSETYYCDTHPESRRLAELVQARLVAHLGRPDGGVRYQPNFPAVREPLMPSCLVEALYMSNPTDLALIMDPAVREKIALAVYEGLWEFFLTP
ncbi:MAG TPA: hypothetical protein DHW14_09935 [Clostridiales bacterium]|nr:hypothetical protein [Clostridiales bacterium]